MVYFGVFYEQGKKTVFDDAYDCMRCHCSPSGGFSFGFSEEAKLSAEKKIGDASRAGELKDAEPIGELRFLDTEELKSRGAIKRIPGKETLCSYVFQNRDGTETAVIFDENIKYVNEAGKTVEKDTTLVRTSSGGFKVKANDYSVLFPKDISDGISFGYMGGKIKLAPEKAGGKLVKEKETVSYSNVFGENTKVRYTPLLNGIKEDIILEKYTGRNSFRFTLDAGGLTLARDESGLVLLNGKKETVMKLGEIIAYDSTGNTVGGSVTYAKGKGSAYVLTVSVPESFLKDPDTVYPVTVDPTIYENTVTNLNVGTYDISVNCGAMAVQGSRIYFDITSFCKGWKRLTYTDTNRIILTSGSATGAKEFGSSESVYSSYRPMITFTYRIKNLMETGTYYIRNRHIDKYLQPVNGSAAAGAGLELRSYTGSSAQKWEVTSLGNGYYTIKSARSSLVITVPPSSYSAYDVQLIQSANTLAEGQQWRIYMTSYGGFAIKPRSSCGGSGGTGWTDHTMSVADGNSGDGALVTQRPYVYNESFKDEWYLVPTDISTTGSYMIKNRNSYTYLRPANGNIFSDNGAVQLQLNASNITRNQWFVYKIPNGLAIKARSAWIHNLVLAQKESLIGSTNVVAQRAFINDAKRHDEWLIRIAN